MTQGFYLEAMYQKAKDGLEAFCLNEAKSKLSRMRCKPQLKQVNNNKLPKNNKNTHRVTRKLNYKKDINLTE